MVEERCERVRMGLGPAVLAIAAMRRESEANVIGATQRKSERSPPIRWRNSKDQDGLPCTKMMGSPAPSSTKCIRWPEGVVKNLLSKGNICADTQSGRADDVPWFIGEIFRQHYERSPSRGRIDPWGTTPC